MAEAQSQNAGAGWQRPTVVFVLSLIVYHLNGRPGAEVDCVVAPYTAWSLVRHGSLDLSFFPELSSYLGPNLQVVRNGVWISQRAPGAALAAIPVVVPFALFRDAALSQTNMMHLGKLAAALSVAGAAAVFFCLCQRLTPRAAIPATILFALGTSLWSVASQALWMHGPATLWLCFALALLLSPGGPPGTARTTLSGLMLGLAIVTRQTTGLFALATLVVLIAGRRWRSACGFAVGTVLPAIPLCLMNLYYFGSPFFGGYGGEDWTDATPLWLGTSGLLFAPSRGLLVYSPALILAPFGGYLVVRGRALPEYRSMLLGWLAAAGATLLFYARWRCWPGGWCFGPRFLTETMPVLCLFFAVGLQGLERAWQWRFSFVLIALSVAVQFVGVFGRAGYADWQLRHDLPDQGRSLFALHDTQIEAHTRAVLAKIGVAKETGNHADP